MARYSIDGQILTNMADAIRAAYIEPVYLGGRDIGDYQELLWKSTNFSISPNSLTWGSTYKLTFIDETPQEQITPNRTFTIEGNTYSTGTEHLVTFEAPTPGTYIQYFRINKIDGCNVIYCTSNVGCSKGKVFLEAVNETTSFADNHTPEEMVAEIEKMESFVKKDSFKEQLLTGSITTVTAADLEGMYHLYDYYFQYCDNLASLELPEGLNSIGMDVFSGVSKIKALVVPSSVTWLHTYAFRNSYITTLTLLNENAVVGGIASTAQMSSSDAKFTEIRVPGKFYNAYKTHYFWNKFKHLFVPYDAWVGEYASVVSTVEFGETASVTIPLLGFDYVPEVSVTTENSDMITIGDINVTTTEITFNIAALEVEGNYTVNIVVTRNDDVEIPVDLTGKIIAELVPGSYTISNPNNHPYTFIDESYSGVAVHQSNNKKQPSTYAYCRVNISNPSNQTVVFDVVNYAEANYDYGLFSNVNDDWSSSNVSIFEGRALHSFKGKSMATHQFIEYNDAIGDCFIDVAFRKDGSGDQNNDCMYFTVSFK